MKISLRLSAMTLGVALLTLPLHATAQTPDGSTPAQEEVCDGLPGALFGLCNAYCEALDCDTGLSSPTACAKVLANFQKKSGGANPPCMVVLDTCKDKATELYDESLKTCQSRDVKVCEAQAQRVYEIQLAACESQCGKADKPAVCQDTWRPCATVCESRADTAYSECEKTGKAEECALKAGDVYRACWFEEPFGERSCAGWCSAECGGGGPCVESCYGARWECDKSTMSCP